MSNNNPFAGLLNLADSNQQPPSKTTPTNEDDKIIANHVLEKVFHITLDPTSSHVYMGEDDQANEFQLLSQDNIDEASFFLSLI